MLVHPAEADKQLFRRKLAQHWAALATQALLVLVYHIPMHWSLALAHQQAVSLPGHLCLLWCSRLVLSTRTVIIFLLLQTLLSLKLFTILLVKMLIHMSNIKRGEAFAKMRHQRRIEWRFNTKALKAYKELQIGIFLYLSNGFFITQSERFLDNQWTKCNTNTQCRITIGCSKIFGINLFCCKPWNGVGQLEPTIFGIESPCKWQYKISKR